MCFSTTDSLRADCYRSTDCHFAYTVFPPSSDSPDIGNSASWLWLGISSSVRVCSFSPPANSAEAKSVSFSSTAMGTRPFPQRSQTPPIFSPGFSAVTVILIEPIGYVKFSTSAYPDIRQGSPLGTAIAYLYLARVVFDSDFTTEQYRVCKRPISGGIIPLLNFGID